MQALDTSIYIIFVFQEREGFALFPVAMPTRMTKKGFPIVHQLDFGSMPGQVVQPDLSPSQLRGGMAESSKKKKSLFARQLERHGLEYFGIEVNELTGTKTVQTSFKKDFVEPVTLVGGVQSPSSREVHVEQRGKVTQSEGAITVTDGQDTMEVDDGGGVTREEFESDASETWKRQVVQYH